MTAMHALNTARRAWSQPQMFLELDGLDETPARATSPGRAGVSSSPFRLNPGAGPGLDSGGDACGAPVVASTHVVFPAPTQHDGGGAAGSWTGSRGAPAEGA